MATIVTVKDLSMHFGNKDVFDRLNFEIQAGEKVSLIGHNGVGKSTLVKLIIGLLSPTSGQITLQDVDGHPLKVGYVPQFRNIDADAPLSINSFVALNIGKNWHPWLNNAEKKRVNDVLEQTNLMAIKHRPLALASGGERQRAYLAQALLGDPDLLIMDESTASMDVDAKQVIMALVDRIVTEKKMALLFVSHDLELTIKYTDRYLLLQDKKVSTGTSDQINPDSLKGAE
ncbi:metal ABC transporter ATP-binding protein [Lapidilactobacillus mulanensis]|uniref:Metal ABC transporter ATP-binding protein n=1 Tax=Lapidilactobacillus mulanensis TaxID=2485999 RepID=A0ABW4DPX4_9LACO|nr:ATP-binding cassette domain-containing protein [Lapidilactobacillus mulanensis]